MSLRGNEIPIKWRRNEIPTSLPLELYTIYNPASGGWWVTVFGIMGEHTGDGGRSSLGWGVTVLVEMGDHMWNGR